MLEIMLENIMRFKRKIKNKKVVAIIVALFIIEMTLVIASQQISKKNGGRINATNSSYEYEDEIDKAMKLFEDSPKPIHVIRDTLLLEDKIALNFEGNIDRETLKKIIEILDQNKLKATFFIPAMELSEEGYKAKLILESGHDIGNYTLVGEKHMEKQSPDRVISELCRSQAIYEKYIGYRPNVIKFNATELTDSILNEASVSGFDSIVDARIYLNYSSFKNEQTAKEYVEQLIGGNIVNIKLSGYLDEIEYKKGANEANKNYKEKGKFANSREELTEESTEEFTKISAKQKTENERLIEMITWVTKAISSRNMETILVKDLKNELGDFTDKYIKLRSENAGKKQNSDGYILTSDREAGFIFRGISDEEEVDEVLSTLEKLKIKGTFFVTGIELEKNWSTVQKIIKAGHQVENGGATGIFLDKRDFETICNEIYMGQLIFKKYGLESSFYMPISSKVNDEICEAANALGVKLITYNFSPITLEYVNKHYSGDEVVENSFGQGRLVLTRGDVVYFNMNIPDDTTFVSNVVEAIFRKKVLPTKYEGDILKICNISELTDHTWNYPAYTNETKDRIQLDNHAIEEIDTLIDHNFIGYKYLKLGGFNRKQLASIDKKGLVNTGGTRTVFLTFDDWGNEESIGKILYVLRKHNVKGTFFINTQFVNEAKMNLLRAIADEGHDIGSHTNTHITVDISKDEVSKLQEDLYKSNQVLSSVVGDTGMLTNYFRPPTLAVNALGLETIFDCGYSWIVCGDNSTGDYAINNKDELVDILINGAKEDDNERDTIVDGSIIIMHMLAKSTYTAEALDDYLTYQEKLPVGHSNKFNFARLSDYLEK